MSPRMKCFLSFPTCSGGKSRKFGCFAAGKFYTGKSETGGGGKAGVSIGGKTLPLLALAGSDAFLWLMMLMLSLHSHGSASGCEVNGNLPPAAVLACHYFFIFSHT